MALQKNQLQKDLKNFTMNFGPQHPPVTENAEEPSSERVAA